MAVFALSCGTPAACSASRNANVMSVMMNSPVMCGSVPFLA